MVFYLMILNKYKNKIFFIYLFQFYVDTFINPTLIIEVKNNLTTYFFNSPIPFE